MEVYVQIFVFTRRVLLFSRFVHVQNWVDFTSNDVSLKLQAAKPAFWSFLRAFSAFALPQSINVSKMKYFNCSWWKGCEKCSDNESYITFFTIIGGILLEKSSAFLERHLNLPLNTDLELSVWTCGKHHASLNFVNCVNYGLVFSKHAMALLPLLWLAALLTCPPLDSLIPCQHLVSGYLLCLTSCVHTCLLILCSCVRKRHAVEAVDCWPVLSEMPVLQGWDDWIHVADRLDYSNCCQPRWPGFCSEDMSFVLLDWFSGPWYI